MPCAEIGDSRKSSSRSPKGSSHPFWLCDAASVAILAACRQIQGLDTKLRGYSRIHTVAQCLPSQNSHNTPRGCMISRPDDNHQDLWEVKS